MIRFREWELHRKEPPFILDFSEKLFVLEGASWDLLKYLFIQHCILFVHFNECLLCKGVHPILMLLIDNRYGVQNHKDCTPKK